MLIPSYKKQFSKDLKRALKRGKSAEKLKAIMIQLIEEKTLAPRYRDHSLKGEHADCRECHVEPDWLLIYLIKDYDIIFIRTGTHADLFK